MTTTTNTTTTRTYRYEVTLAGSGGEFWFIPMTPDQVTFWRAKGNFALAKHLKGYEWDEAPPEMQLGYYEDVGEDTFGLDTSLSGEVIVRNERREVVFEASIADSIDHKRFTVTRDVVAPAAGAVFRTHENSEWTYELELTDRFDPSQLCLRLTKTTGPSLVSGLIYCGDEIISSHESDKETATYEAELIG